MVKDKRESSGSTILGSLIRSCFFVSSSAGKGQNVRMEKSAQTSSGAEATMVAAAKQFSLAHKVRLD
ncbi:hypothetical protein Pyn_14763 [Prunus yedoensis var. nudiflora]|uniref:Uncharacterized protein n=1 Tax=Prunus yedoensis var. nudiflora TaxID=2094558 RepID=A0A314ZFZ5_PRUYE|nr:hypothetical protein Pyn_14763 [Prunus yedoensis var. nudiflora]